MLHGAAIGLLVGLTWAVKEAVEEPPPIVVVLDGAPGGPATSTVERGEDASPGVDGTEAGATTLFTAPPSVRKWTPPPPAAVDASGIVDPEPLPSVTGRPVSRRKPVETVAVPSARPRVNFGEYLDQHPLPGRPSAAPRSGEGSSVGQRPRIAVPRIDENGGTGLSRPTVQAGEGMATYFAGLVGQLREAHEKPAGLSDLLSAEVRFTVAADGGISDVGITRSSGDAGFDRSVREAFARVKLPKRPDGKADVRTLTFRIREA